MKVRTLLLSLLLMPLVTPPAEAQIPYTPVLDFSCDFYYYGYDIDPRYDRYQYIYCEIVNSNQHDITVEISMTTGLNMQLQDETVTVSAQNSDLVYVDFLRDRTTTKGAHQVELTAIITRYASVMTCDSCEEETRTKQVNVLAWFEMDWNLKEDPYEDIGRDGSQEVCPDNGKGDVVLEVSLDGNEGSALGVSVNTEHELYSEHLDYDDDRIPEYDKGRDGALVIDVLDDGGTIEPGESSSVRIRMTFVGLPEEPALFRLNLFASIVVYPVAMDGGSDSCFGWYGSSADCYRLNYACNTVENHGILDLIEEERQDFTDRLDEEQAESSLGHPGGSLFVLVALLGAALSSRAQRPRA